jgi:hypothetical protein
MRNPIETQYAGICSHLNGKLRGWPRIGDFFVNCATFLGTFTYSRKSLLQTVSSTVVVVDYQILSKIVVAHLDDLQQRGIGISAITCDGASY